MKTGATKKLPGEGFKRAWPPLIKMDEGVKAKIDALFGKKCELAQMMATSSNINAAHEIPSPTSGERVRVRGLRRNRTAEARDFARKLREKSTDAEKRLWRLLRDRRFADFKFRRQYPCGIYFLDFYCVEAKLAVELDGGGHGFPDQRAKDEVRNKFLASKGIKVLRFWNHQMRDKLESIRLEVWHELMMRTGRTDEIAGFKPATPHPDLLPSEGRRKPKARAS